VASAWVGTTVPQSILLERVVESVIQTGKTVTLAVKSEVPPSDAYEEHEHEIDKDAWNDEILQ
jgi:hypothetical protein